MEIRTVIRTFLKKRDFGWRGVSAAAASRGLVAGQSCGRRCDRLFSWL